MNENYSKIEKSLNFMMKNFKLNPSLDDLAKNICLSKFHYLRIFREYTWITPKQFLNFLAFNESQKYLKTKSMLKTSNLVWFGSSSKLHNLYVNITWVTPEEWRKNGKWVEIIYWFWNTIFWEALIWITKKWICYLWFVWENKEELLKDFIKAWWNWILKNDEKLSQEYLDKIFINKEKFNLFVKWTNFQMKVWESLLSIPDGELTTYWEISNILNNPAWVRAVASAIWDNHIWYLIPCHRVISKMWLLSWYKWGIGRKEMLIYYEGSKTFEG